MENWSRPNWQEYAQSPHLFYAVLGEFEMNDELREMRAILPRDLDCRLVEAEQFRTGVIWDMLERENPALAQSTQNVPNAVVVQGEVEVQSTLDYLKNTLDFLTYLTDQGGTTVYDPFTLSWYSHDEWQSRADEGQIFNPFDHVVLLSSPEDELLWLHTRGLLKFGRPDLSVRNVPPADMPIIKKMLDRFISFQALGGVIEEGREVILEGLVKDLRPGPVSGNLNDPDFNNFHIEISEH